MSGGKFSKIVRMDFCVAKLAGKQYLIFPGDTLEVGINLGQVGDRVILDQVLLVAKDGNIAVGMPLVPDIKVLAEIIFSGEGEKIRVAKFRAKSRYRRVLGFKSKLTKLNILGIGDGEIPEATPIKEEKETKEDGAPVKRKKKQ